MGKIMVNGVNYSGSEVEMNPTIPSGATVTPANNVKVDDDYYSFPQGGGGGVNYSSQEQDTGLTWLNGEHIYQKTFVKTNAAAGNIDFDLDFADTDIELFVNRIFVLKRTDGKIVVDTSYTSDWSQDHTHGYTFFVGNDDNKWHYTVQTGYYGADEVYLTVQYIKATTP